MRSTTTSGATWAAPGGRHADVLPYFRKMENSWRGAGPAHGATGPLSVQRVDSMRLGGDPVWQAARAAGHLPAHDFSVDQGTGFGDCEVTVDRRGRRASTSRAYLRPASSRPNLTVLTGATAHQRADARPTRHRRLFYPGWQD